MLCEKVCVHLEKNNNRQKKKTIKLITGGIAPSFDDFL